MKDILSYLAGPIPVLVILCGYPFAGKSYFAEQVKKQHNDVAVVSINKILTGQGFGWSADELPGPEDWSDIYEQSYRQTRALLGSEMSVIYTHTSHTVACRAVLQRLALAAHAIPIVVYVDTPVADAWKCWEAYLLNQGQSIADEMLIASIIANFEPPTKAEEMKIIRVA